jgi:hypothetical protein
MVGIMPIILKTISTQPSQLWYEERGIVITNSYNLGFKRRHLPEDKVSSVRARTQAQGDLSSLLTMNFHCSYWTKLIQATSDHRDPWILLANFCVSETPQRPMIQLLIKWLIKGCLNCQVSSTLGWLHYLHLIKSLLTHVFLSWESQSQITNIEMDFWTHVIHGYSFIDIENETQRAQEPCPKLFWM